MGKYDWNKLSQNLQEDALTDKKSSSYEKDDRFYTLARNDRNIGGAVIRFLLSPDEIPFVKMYQIDAQGAYQRRFISEWSPTTIGKPDPVNEKFLELWGQDLKDEARKFGRKIRYIANIKVIKDPATPANEGKIFLLDMSKTLFDKLKNAVEPDPEEMALDPDLKPKEIFDPVNGFDFLFKVKKGQNGFFTFEDSKFADKATATYADDAAYEKAIKADGYKLGTFLEEDFFKTYDELKEKLAWYQGIDTRTAPAKPEVQADVPAESLEERMTPKAETKPEPEAKPEPKDELDDLDSLLDELV